MKRIFTFLAVLFTTFIVRAGNNEGAISITSLSNQNVRIEVDNKNYTNREGSVIIRNLLPGYHSIRVYRVNEISTRSSVSYVSQKRLLYSANIRVKPLYHVDIVINRFGKALIDERYMDSNYMTEFCSNDDSQNNRDNYNDDYNRRDNDNRDRDNRDRDNYSRRPMNDQTFASFIQTMKKESFESTRLDLTKQTAAGNYFTTSQVKQLIALFTFEDSKLDVAKYVYGNTTDRENYFLLYDSFTYSRSKEELAAYCRNYK
jgi:hypothetical protein